MFEHKARVLFNLSQDAQRQATVNVIGSISGASTPVTDRLLLESAPTQVRSLEGRPLGMSSSLMLPESSMLRLLELGSMFRHRIGGTAVTDDRPHALREQGEMEAFDGYYRPGRVKHLVMTAVPEAATRVAMLERGEADIIYNVPGGLITKVGKLPGVPLAPVLSRSFFMVVLGLIGAWIKRGRR